MPVNVRRFHPSEWREYRHLRLRALKNAPDAFATTWDQSIVIPEGRWRDRIAKATGKDDLPLLAEVDGQMVGIAWGKILQPGDRVAHLFQMWVAPGFRGRGAGRRLVDTVLRWAEERGVAAVELEVTRGNEAAERLYRATGFVAFGEPSPLRPGSKLLEQSMRHEFAARGAAPV